MIKLAKFAGFCYGVKRAVETAKKLKEENPDKNIYILGELIHNTDVINELENLGIKTIYEIPEKEVEVVDALCKIKPDISIYITLRYYNDMTYNDVAKALKQPVSTVKYRTKNALNELKKYLEGDVTV